MRLALVTLLVLASTSQAQQCSSGTCQIPQFTQIRYQKFAPVQLQTHLQATKAPQVAFGLVSDPTEALGEVNAARKARGLAPYAYDPQLTAGALNVAKFRAERRMAGHTSNDFAGLPVGVSAKAAGCAALHPSWGFQACAMFDGYRFCGAASVMGSDGLRYSHLFVR